MKRSAGSSRAMDVDVTCHELPDGSDHRLLSSVTVKRRKSWLLAASALASSSLGVSEPALAQVCSAAHLQPQMPRATLPARAPLPPPSTTAPSPTTPCTSRLIRPSVSPSPAPGIAVNLNNFSNPGSPVLLSANGATINVTNPAAGEHRGLYVETVSANATITASGQIDVAGGVQGSHAIKAFVNTAAQATRA